MRCLFGIWKVAAAKLYFYKIVNGIKDKDHVAEFLCKP